MPEPNVLDFTSMISARSRSIDASGIRRVFDLGARLKDPINLSIGQPDFPVPDSMKDAAIAAIRANRNGYTVTQGVPELRARIAARLLADVGWSLPSESMELVVTSGTSGGLVLAFMALLDPGDEAIMPDPYFVMYPQLGKMIGSRSILCDTYPDFRMTAERVESLITDRTKILLVNSPANPTGVVLNSRELHDLVDLCESRGIVLISDEIYDEFTYPEGLEDGKFPSPARFSENVLLIRGFGKSYGCTGWRLGYAAGPKPIIEEIAKLQQYTYVCAPSMAQWGAIESFDFDLSPIVDSYRERRDLVVNTLGKVTDVAFPGGAFYAFVKVPEKMGETATQFVERAISKSVLVIPGGVFSRRDTHFRLSYAAPPEKLKKGVEILAELLSGRA